MNAVSQVGAARVCGGLHSCDEVYCLHSSCTTINRDTTVLGRHANTPCILNRYTQLRMHIMPPFRYTQLHMHVIPPFLSPVSHSSFSSLLPFSPSSLSPSIYHSISTPFSLPAHCILHAQHSFSLFSMSHCSRRDHSQPMLPLVHCHPVTVL